MVILDFLPKLLEIRGFGGNGLTGSTLLDMEPL